jgi:hypothetical protein
VSDHAPGLPPGAADLEAELAALADSAVFYHRHRAAVAAGANPGGLVGPAVARAATLADRAEERAKAAQPTACRRGCAWCCHQNVRVSAAEVFHLARWLRSRLAEAELEALAVHVHESATQLNGMAQPERARKRIACALLDPASGACRAHEARPMLCRGQLSVSAKTCQRAVESPGVYRFEPLLDAIHGAGLASMSLELEFAFFGGGPVSGELTAMLSVALTQPGAEATWTGGGNPFPRHNEFSTHLNSRLAWMLAAAWGQLEPPRGDGDEATAIRAAAMKFLRQASGAGDPAH